MRLLANLSTAAFLVVLTAASWIAVGWVVWPVVAESHRLLPY